MAFNTVRTVLGTEAQLIADQLRTDAAVSIDMWSLRNGIQSKKRTKKRSEMNPQV